MSRLDIVWMIISPSPSHAFGIDVVWHDVVVVGEFLVADWTLPVLLDNLPVQEFPHFRRRSEFPIPSRVMRVFNALDTEAYSAGLSDLFPATAEQRSVDRTVFIATESHGIPPVGPG